MRESVIIYTSINEILQELSDEDKGKLFQAIIDYQLENPVNLTGMLKLIFIQVRQQIDMNNQKYEDAKKKKSEAGKKGMENRWKKNNTVKNINNKNNTVITSDNKNNTVKNVITDDNKEKSVNNTDNKHNLYGNGNIYGNIYGNDNINYKEIVDYYNDTCVSLPKVKVVTDARKKTIKSRLKKYTISDLFTVFDMASRSDFLNGKNDRGWSANFDWLLNERNMAKVLEGNYSNRDKQTQMQDKYNFLAEFGKEE